MTVYSKREQPWTVRTSIVIIWKNCWISSVKWNACEQIFFNFFQRSTNRKRFRLKRTVLGLPRKPEPEVCNIRCPPFGCPRGPCPGMCCYDGVCDPCCMSKMPRCPPSPHPPRCRAPPLCMLKAYAKAIGYPPESCLSPQNARNQQNPCCPPAPPCCPIQPNCCPPIQVNCCIPPPANCCPPPNCCTLPKPPVCNGVPIYVGHCCPPTSYYRC